MVIKASAAVEIRQLIEALGGSDDVRREAAIARLAVIGPRAADALHKTYVGTSDRDTRIAVLRALEPIGDHRTIALARDALGAGGDLARSAASALRSLLDSSDERTATESLDALVATALDRSADHAVRLAALDALQGMPEDVRSRLAQALEQDSDPHVKARVGDLPRDAAAADAIWADAIEGRLPDAPAVLREAAQTRAAATALGTLQKLIDAIRVREGTVATAVKRTEWQAVRGALHQALALRGSRVAVYDLRESLADARSPLPTSFLAALHVVGDRSCLEPIAAAYVSSPRDDARWKAQLAGAFRAIAKREKITRRHQIARRIQERWPEAGRDLTAPA